MEHWTGDDNHLLAIKVNIFAQYCHYVYNMKSLFKNTAQSSELLNSQVNQTG